MKKTIQTFCLIISSLTTFCQPTNRDFVNQLIQNSSPVPVNPPTRVTKDMTEFFQDGDRKYDVFKQHNKIEAQFESMVAFDPNKQGLWPGSIIQCKDLPNGILTPIGFPRTPLSIGVTNLLGSNVKVLDTVVQKPSFTKMNTVLNRVITQDWDKDASARMEASAYVVQTVEQSLIDLGISAHYSSFAMAGGLFSNHTSNSFSYVVKFVQNYYSVTCNPPVLPTSFFDLADQSLQESRLSIQDFKSVISPNNPPAYISTVNYGRMLIFVFTVSNASDEEKAWLKASFNSLAGGASFSLNQEQRKTIQKCSINFIVLGGTANEGANVISLKDSVKDKADLIANFIKDGANSYKNAVPISYVANYLKDNSLARVSSSTEYDIITGRTEKPYLQRVTVYTHTHGDDKDSEESVLFQIKKTDGQQIASSGDLGGGVTWHDNTDQSPIELVMNPSVPIYQGDCSNIRFYWIKHPDKNSGRGWRMSIRVIGHLSNGKDIELHKVGERLIGDGHQYEFSEGINCNW